MASHIEGMGNIKISGIEINWVVEVETSVADKIDI